MEDKRNYLFYNYIKDYIDYTKYERKLSKETSKNYEYDLIHFNTFLVKNKYNLNDYYRGMKELMSHMIEMGLSTHEKQKGIYFADHLDDRRKSRIKRTSKKSHITFND